MAKTASVNIRLDPETKKSAETVYSYYGLSLTEAITVFIHQSCNVGGLPFDLRPTQPNAVSLAAMKEAESISRDPNVKGYKDMVVLFESLEADE
ncbi:MAG: type II toxin-antitoxin system RelB/DinJ family antitoxin [Oscillospiraceae bacterium]|jgi:DNA-damage-inducible protein J|nr:type II toxin-antitoxin system RelB/DinJ family antitoxin [Oscillospiraceae bacterium]